MGEALEIVVDGWHGSVTGIDCETGLIHGEACIGRDIITFKATNVKDLVKEFKVSIKDLLREIEND